MRPPARTAILQIKVKPNARESTLARLADGTWQARIRFAPIEGRADSELVALVAWHFCAAHVPGDDQQRRHRAHQTGSYRLHLITLR